MNTRLSQILKISLISPVIIGLFALPLTASASWMDALGSFGLGSNSSGSSSYSDNSYYDANSVIGQSEGDIKLSKRARRINQDQDYHETSIMRSGTQVEIWIEVKNESNQNATVIVTDELGGSVVYKKDSLRVNGQTSAPGLTSGGLRLNMSPKSKTIITYQMYVCGGSSYAIRARAYSAGIGSATDAIVIQTEEVNRNDYNTELYSNQVYSCMNQVQATSTTTTGTTVASNANYNPFGDWTGVQNFSTTTTTTPKTTAVVTGDYNPFGDWTGVNNFASTSYNTTPAYATNTSANPFGDWTGVSSESNYDMRGYSTATPVSYANNQSNDQIVYTTTTSPRTTAYAPVTTNYVAPTTGVNQTAPLWFGGLVTAGFIAFRKRKLIFN